MPDKKIYAFGDSIMAGHKYKKAAFIDFVAAKQNMDLNKYARNGATIMDVNYEGGQILSQIIKASERKPDFILFDGGTNDAEYILNCKDIFDYEIYRRAFEKTVKTIQTKWNNTPVIYVAAHKLGSRDIVIQEKIRNIAFKICEQYQVIVADVYNLLDTNDVNKKNKYTFDELTKNGLPGMNGSGTHPNLAAIEEYYVPVVCEAFKEVEL